MSRKSITKEEFENRIKCMFNNKYNLIGDFINIKTKVEMNCSEHGVFLILPSNMLYKEEKCKLCGLEEMAKSKSLTKQEFVNKANKVFKNSYDYNLSNYKNNSTKIKIICKSCGNIFEKTPNNHLKGQGCPSCFSNQNLKH